MNKFRKNLIIVLEVIISLSVIITILGTIIFLFDINGAKGLIPLIFFFIFIFFIFSFLVDVMNKSQNKKFRFDIVKLIFAALVLIVFILSLFVYWI